MKKVNELFLEMPHTQKIFRYCTWFIYPLIEMRYILVIFQVASLLAALSHPSHIVRYAPGDSRPCRRDAS
ncbi:hypothetical protein PluDJC_04070 [Photorhabdus laumondii subsp. laumondii]|nr:hypothetical protein PluDJC_04070 [Photorhabdus laumondii subsp. laumondii]